MKIRLMKFWAVLFCSIFLLSGYYQDVVQMTSKVIMRASPLRQRKKGLRVIIQMTSVTDGFIRNQMDSNGNGRFQENALFREGSIAFLTTTLQLKTLHLTI